MKKSIITISGLPGSGKSSTAREVARKLGYEHFSSGDLFRKMARERNLSIEEINFAAEKQKEIDWQVDELSVKIGKERNKIVIDSRIAFHWIPDSFKVFLEIDPKTAAERTFKSIKKKGRERQFGLSVDEVYENNRKRVESEKKRYKNLYGIDIANKEQFDLVMDVGINNLEKVASIVVEKYENWLNS